MKSGKAGVIGAGLGGLAVSCLLANEGYNVTVYEKNSRPGGKMGEVTADGFRFDTGPSLVTMPSVLERLFERCGAHLSDYITLTEPEPLCRYFYPDGTRFDNYRPVDKAADELKKIAPDELNAYFNFLDYASRLYDKTSDAFLFNPLYDFLDIRHLNFRDLAGIDAFNTVSERVNSRFESTYLRQFFKRFTTYNGSSPYQAPATLNVIPHVEINLGGYYVDGGLYRMVEALVQLGRELGVEYRYESVVSEILTDKNRVCGIALRDDTTINLDLVISNSDANETYLALLPKSNISFLKRKMISNTEPSCSGFVLLLGIDRRYEQLVHHNVFFSEDYRDEFHTIFRKRLPPSDPTIYIANTSHTNPQHAEPTGSNLFVLVNAPSLDGNIDWNIIKNEYASRLMGKLEERGLKGLRDAVSFKTMITPIDFYQKFRSNRGSIYGTSSNGLLSAFYRPRNKSRSIEGLYLAGGSTHPGGGIPLVILSAFHCMELIKRYRG